MVIIFSSILIKGLLDVFSVGESLQLDFKAMKNWLFTMYVCCILKF